MWKRSLAALGAGLLLALTGCSGSDGDSDPDATEATSSDSTPGDDTDDPTDEESTPTAPQTTKDPTKGGGFKYLPSCDEIAESIVEGEAVEDTEEVAGRSCRFTIGADPLVGRQTVWITRGGGDWPSRFKADELNEKLAEAADPGDGEYTSSVSEVDAPGWDYGLQFDEKIGKSERTSYRLMAFAKNGDLLTCHTGVPDADVDAFRKWCDKVLESVQP